MRIIIHDLPEEDFKKSLPNVLNNNYHIIADTGDTSLLGLLWVLGKNPRKLCDYGSIQ